MGCCVYKMNDDDYEYLHLSWVLTRVSKENCDPYVKSALAIVDVIFKIHENVDHASSNCQFD